MKAINTTLRCSGLILLLIAATACGSTESSSTSQPSAEPESTIQSANPCEMPDGILAFASYRDGESELYVIRADGTALIRLTDGEERVSKPAWSPDGTRIAYVVTDENFRLNIFTMYANGSKPIQLTDGYSVDTEPAWSPTGDKIAFSSSRDSYLDIQDDMAFGLIYEFEIYAMEADGSGQVNLTNAPGWDTAPAWSPDGRRILFQSNRDGNPEIYLMNADGSDQINLTNHPSDDATPAWSPDGTKIAFHSDRDGDFDIYMMNDNGTGVVQLTDSPRWDIEASWSPDGQHIAFYSGRDGNFEVYLMDAYGSCQTRLTYDREFNGFPDWQP